MLKKTISTMFIIVSSTILFFSYSNSIESYEGKPSTPIFDGYVGNNSYQLDDCYEDIGIMGSDFFSRSFASEKLKKNFKSKQWSKIKETWSSPLGGLTIYRYRFESPQDAILYPETGYSPISSPGFLNKGWSNTVDIGDKTCWVTPFIVLFTKDKFLVRISFSSSVLSEKQMNEYVRKIAENIVKKL